MTLERHVAYREAGALLLHLGRAIAILASVGWALGRWAA
jgi:hypothetical protein